MEIISSFDQSLLQISSILKMSKSVIQWGHDSKLQCGLDLILSGLLNSLTCRNLARICIIFAATQFHTWYFQIILFATSFFKPSHNIRRKAKHFSRLKRFKNATGRKETGKNIVDMIFIFTQIRDSLNSHTCSPKLPDILINI